MTHGYLIDARRRLSKKTYSRYDICLRNETGVTVLEDEMPFEYHVKGSGQAGKDLEQFMGAVPVEKMLPGGHEKLEQLSVKNFARRAESRRQLKTMHRRTSLIGSKRSLEPDYLLRKFHPYEFLEAGSSGLVRTQRKYPLKMRWI